MRASGATPDKWDVVTTGYDKAALHELGQHLGLSGGLTVDDAHSTGEATLWGEKFEVDLATLKILEEITRDEQKMLGHFYCTRRKAPCSSAASSTWSTGAS